MQPSKNGVERDYLNNPLASAFNAAIMLQKELMGLDSYRAFLLVYFKEAATRYFRSIDDPIINVKMQADLLGVTKDTVYDMAHKFVFTSYNMAVANCNLNCKMQTMRLDNYSFVDQFTPIEKLHKF